MDRFAGDIRLFRPICFAISDFQFIDLGDR